MARLSSIRYPNESAEYRAARTALLEEEIALRRHIERVAEMRRALPPGGAVPQDYVFQGMVQGAPGPVTLSELFGKHDTLITYNWMFGPQRKQPCPMCTSLLGAFEGEMADILQRVGFATIARSPVERMVAFAKERGWRHMPLVSAAGNDFNQLYAGDKPGSESENPALNVFHRGADGVIRHFWGGEMDFGTADPGQDPRGAPDPMPIWNLLDLTPGGRGKDWYPELSYPA